MSSLAKAIVETITQPLLVLDGGLRVEAANRSFLQQFEVDPAETLGRLVYDLGNGQWNIAGLRRLLEEVLSEDGTVVDYRVEHEFESIGERVMLLNGNRMRREDTTDTILLAITDITEGERLRFELEGQKEFAEKLIDSVRESLVVLGWDLRVHSANESFYTRFAVTREETEGRLIYELGNRQWDIPRLRLLLEEILPKENSFDDYEIEHEFESIGNLDVNLNGETTFALADKLLTNNVPVIFATGYDSTMLPGRFADVYRLPKPFTALAVEGVFRRIFAADQATTKPEAIRAASGH